MSICASSLRVGQCVDRGRAAAARAPGAGATQAWRQQKLRAPAMHTLRRKWVLGHYRPRGRIWHRVDFRFTAIATDVVRCHQMTRWAMCGRLRVGKDFLHECSIGRCSHVFGLLGAVHMTAGHNALRGSGPGQKLAFDNALAHVGCPDRRIDRLCITCCSSSQPSHHARYWARSR